MIADGEVVVPRQCPTQGCGLFGKCRHPDYADSDRAEPQDTNDCDQPNCDGDDDCRH